ncbi:MAG TPA: glycerate kinase, partial [bacterium]|nr:glycerate kinase [bacterium]
MRIVIAPNAFKECLSPAQVSRAIERGVKRASASAKTVLVPLADGGDGTVEALVTATQGRIVEALVSDPLGRSIQARYGILGNGETAVIEMAEASGLKRIASEERNPLITSTRGTGDLVLDAMRNGVRSIVLGIGGSATVDGGT